MLLMMILLLLLLLTLERWHPLLLLLKMILTLSCSCCCWIHLIHASSAAADDYDADLVNPLHALLLLRSMLEKNIRFWCCLKSPNGLWLLEWCCSPEMVITMTMMIMLTASHCKIFLKWSAMATCGHSGNNTTVISYRVTTDCEALIKVNPKSLT